MSGTVRIRVCRACEGQVLECTLELPPGGTAAQAAAASGLADACWNGALAIHGVVVEGAALLHEGDRVEMLAPLQVDPRTRRRRRAARRG